MNRRLLNRSAVTKEYIRRYRKGKPDWLMMEIAAGLDCNLCCKHCSVGKIQKQSGSDSFSLDHLKNLLVQAKERGFLSICFVGGEPLCYPYLDEAVKFTAELQMLPSIITNGLLLDEERLEALVISGIDTICFSINSIDAEEHDRIVNCNGAFRRIMEVLVKAQQQDVEVAVSVVPFKETIDSGKFQQLCEMLNEQKIKLNINYPAIVGNNRDLNSLLPPEYVEKVRQCHAKCQSWSDFMLSGMYACPACKHSVYVIPSGEIMACAFLHVSFGNIFCEELSLILEKMKKHPVFMPGFDHCIAGEDPHFVEEHILSNLSDDSYFIPSEKLL